MKGNCWIVVNNGLASIWLIWLAYDWFVFGFYLAYMCFLTFPNMAETQRRIHIVSQVTLVSGSRQLDLRLDGESPFGCSSRVLPQTCVCRPSGLHHARRWHISSAFTPPENALAPNSSKLCCAARVPTSRGPIHTEQSNR